MLEIKTEVIYERVGFGGDHSCMMKIVESFEKTYLGKHDVNGRVGAIYDIRDWNFYDLIFSDTVTIPRTNNLVEGFHRGFAQRFTGDHPPIMKFIKGVQQQQRITDYLLNRIDHDISVCPKRKTKRLNEDDLSTLVRSFHSKSIKDYMMEIVSIIGYPVKV